MSKSLGNFYTLRDLLNRGYKPTAIRYLLLSTHYRQQLNFTFDALEAAGNAVQRLNDFMALLREKTEEGSEHPIVKSLVDNVAEEFEAAMDDDLNISAALAAIFEFIKAIYKLEEEREVLLNKKDAELCIEQMLKFDTVLGVISAKEFVLDKETEELIAQREHARLHKDFKKADEIREELRRRGIILEDTAKGVRWKRA